MRKIVLSATILGLLAMLFSCNPMKKIETTQTSAYSAFQNGNFKEALTLYQQLMKLYEEDSKEVPIDILVNTAKSAYGVKDYELATVYFTKAFEKGKSMALLMELIDATEKLNNNAELKKLLEDNINVLSENGMNDFVYNKLFKLNYSEGNYEKAYSDYKKIKDPDIDLFPEFLDVLNKLDKKDEAEKACKSFLVQNKDDIAALEWLAIDEYNKANNWYKSEMAKYNKNKNATTYAYLRRDLKKISSVFRSARDKFVKLHDLNPGNKQYIKYLKNCYLMLDMKSDAAKMDKLLNK